MYVHIPHTNILRVWVASKGLQELRLATPAEYLRLYGAREETRPVQRCFQTALFCASRRYSRVLEGGSEDERLIGVTYEGRLRCSICVLSEKKSSFRAKTVMMGNGREMYALISPRCGAGSRRSILVTGSCLSPRPQVHLPFSWSKNWCPTE